ncbi:MAG: hypothetical protein ACJA00_003733 [Myxococcota bacterium]|jgi:hypothetical protein
MHGIVKVPVARPGVLTAAKLPGTIDLTDVEISACAAIYRGQVGGSSAIL